LPILPHCHFPVTDKHNNYELIFMDIYMPKIDGIEATKKIREIEKNRKVIRKIPNIAMTANSM